MASTLRILVSRHSAFYSPLISTIAAGFLEQEGLSATYGILQPGQRSQALIRDGFVDILQSAVSSNWKAMERGETDLPVHFAQINIRDGFFIAGRSREPEFTWKALEGKPLLADHGLQPLVMLKYAVHFNGVDWTKIQVIDAGSPEQMQSAFRAGEGFYLHRQGPGAGLPLVSVGASMPAVAFSSLCASREFVKTEVYTKFLRAYETAREWVRSAAAEDIAAKELSFFPGVDVAVLAETIRQYQMIGCWGGGLQIPRDLYEQALNVFEYAGEIKTRPKYDEVCL